MSGKLAIAITTAAAALITALLALAFATCGASESIDREPLTIVAANGTTARLEVEIADTPEERERGLMGRTELLPDTGMLFVVDPPGRGFWMKDTRLALSVAFIEDCGRIVEIADLEPLSERIVNTAKPYGFGLEVARGWFERNGIAVGDIVAIPRNYRKPGCD